MSLGIVVGGKYIQTLLDQNFNSDVDCTFVKFSNITEVELEYNNTNIANISKIKTYCYCKDYLYKHGPFQTQTYVVDNIRLCQSWFILYVKAYSVSIATIIVIPFINAILVLLLGWLTEFERNKTISLDKMSNISKIFLMQMINTVKKLFKIFRG